LVEHQLPKLRVAGSNPVARSISDTLGDAMGASLVESEAACPEIPVGVVVVGVRPGSPAALAGLRPRDRIIGVNGQPVSDTLDLYAASFDRSLTVRLDRAGTHVTLSFIRMPGEEIGIEVCPDRPAVCNNKCVFCFVDQMPPGMRESLYVKDEDYRLSFLHGSYLTLTNLVPSDEERIRRMHLSPLYVSIHATDLEARARLLGRRPREPVLTVMDRLARSGIKFHGQVVLVPGYNDGAVLERTLADTCDRHAYVLSLSVVPVGLTGHRSNLARIRPVDRRLAEDAIGLIRDVQIEMRSRIGRGLAYAGDELFMLAGRPIPEESYYDDYPQIDNGVGLTRMFLDGLRGLRVPAELRGRRLILVTGTLAAPHIEKAAHLLRRRGVSAEVVIVSNRLFGPTVSVSGLLAGRDIVNSLAGAGRADAVVLPPSLTNADGLTLDGLTLEDISAMTGMPVVGGDYGFKSTLKRIRDACDTKQSG
jgi:putative radical SAM enzyme (TIGR03279 family)